MVEWCLLSPQTITRNWIREKEWENCTDAYASVEKLFFMACTGLF